jgi:hypothetical protein
MIEAFLLHEAYKKQQERERYTDKKDKDKKLTPLGTVFVIVFIFFWIWTVYFAYHCGPEENKVGRGVYALFFPLLFWLTKWAGMVCDKPVKNYGGGFKGSNLQ